MNESEYNCFFFFICEMLSICYAAVTMKNGRQLEK